MLWRPGETLSLTVGGTRLEARCWGPPPSDAPTLVLLHEGLGCVALWRDFPTRLARITGFGVIAYSRLGYGASDPCTLPRPIDYMEREADHVLGAVLDAAGLRNVLLIGHSDGGSIAALYAGGAQDDRLDGAILVAPHFFVEDISIHAIKAARKAYLSGDLRARLAAYHDNVDTAFMGWNDAWLNPAFRDWDITGCLTEISVPVMAMQGRADPYGTPAQINVIAEKCTSRTELHLLDACRHAPHLEQSEKTLALIASFARSLQ